MDAPASAAYPTRFTPVTLVLILFSLGVTLRIDWPFGDLLRSYAHEGSVAFQDSLFRFHAGVGILASTFAGLGFGSSIRDIVQRPFSWASWGMFALGLGALILRFVR